MEKEKKRKLMHYLDSDPIRFIQYDIYTDAEAYPKMHPDKDGDALSQEKTVELMPSAPNVRVLILPNTGKKAVLRSLRKVAAWIKREPELLEWLPEPNAELLEQKLAHKVRNKDCNEIIIPF